jgi:hypothetical protein
VTVNTFAAVRTAVELPPGLSTRIVRVPITAVGAIETFAVRLVPLALTVTFETVINESGADVPKKVRPVAPVRLTPVTVIWNALGRVLLFGAMAVITGTLAALALPSTVFGGSTTGADPNRALALAMTVVGGNSTGGAPWTALAAASTNVVALVTRLSVFSSNRVGHPTLSARMTTYAGFGIAGGDVYNPFVEIVPVRGIPPTVPFTRQTTAGSSQPFDTTVYCTSVFGSTAMAVPAIAKRETRNDSGDVV